jgi:hypothetical protein
MNSNDFYKGLFNESSLDLDTSTITQLTVSEELNITGATLIGLPVDEVTLTFPASVVLKVKDFGIGTNQLADLSVTNDKIVSVDGSKITGTIHITTLRVGDGTVNNPSYSFINDHNSGIYLVGTSDIGITVNSTKVLDITEGFIEALFAFVADTLTSNTIFISYGSSYFYDTIQVIPFSTGLVHSDSSGNLSSSLLVDADITPLTITAASLAGSIPDSKLLTISTAGRLVILQQQGLQIILQQLLF